MQRGFIKGNVEDAGIPQKQEQSLPPSGKFILSLTKLLYCLLSEHQYCYICDPCSFFSKPEKVWVTSRTGPKVKILII